MDRHEELKTKLNEAMDRQGTDEFDLGPMKVERDLSGGLVVNDSGQVDSLDRMPPEAYEKTMQAIERYNELSSDGGLK